MICHVYDFRGEHLLRQEEREPVCGKDFCDSCGDCLHCYGGDTCVFGDGTHLWVEYKEQSPGEMLAAAERLQPGITAALQFGREVLKALPDPEPGTP